MCLTHIHTYHCLFTFYLYTNFYFFGVQCYQFRQRHTPPQSGFKTSLSPLRVVLLLLFNKLFSCSSPGYHWSVFHFHNFAIPTIPYKGNHKACSFLNLASFTKHRTFVNHPCCSMCLQLILCYRWVILCCLYVSQYVYQYICWRTFELFLVVGIKAELL